jgi:hypothetical protein
MKHRGEIVEKVVRESGMPLTEIARRLNKSRRHIYNMFDNPNLSIDEIVEIGKIVNYDFSKEFTDVRSGVGVLSDSNEQYHANSSNWKEKYIELLEKYNKLLEQQLADKFNKKEQ